MDTMSISDQEIMSLIDMAFSTNVSCYDPTEPGNPSAFLIFNFSHSSIQFNQYRALSKLPVLCVIWKANSFITTLISLGSLCLISFSNNNMCLASNLPSKKSNLKSSVVIFGKLLILFFDDLKNVNPEHKGCYRSKRYKKGEFIGIISISWYDNWSGLSVMMGKKTEHFKCLLKI